VSAVEVHPLTPERWPDLERLFGPSGAYSNCWCTFQRQTGREFAAGCENRGAGNRALLRALTDGGSPPGLIAYRDGVPVGWVSVGPRTEFGRILRSPITHLTPVEAANPTTWAIVCFWMPRAERGKGLGRTLLRAAIGHARSSGAMRLEGYPVDTHGARIPDGNAFTGTLDLFAGEGFASVSERVTGRPLVVLRLSEGSA
jgi:GNAT superfamily N-acetyltransferase